MPNFESITKWYNQSQIEYITPFLKLWFAFEGYLNQIQSQIEYITPFLKLWFAFEGYLNQIFPTENNQRDLIEKIKTESHLFVWFEKYINESSEAGDIFKNAIERLTKLTDIEPLLNSKGERISFSSLIDKRERPPETEVFKFQGVNLTRDCRAIFKQLIEVIYQARCNLMLHGNFSLDNYSHLELLEKAYIALNMMFGSIIKR
jgi:hypothetical protein